MCTIGDQIYIFGGILFNKKRENKRLICQHIDKDKCSSIF